VPLSERARSRPLDWQERRRRRTEATAPNQEIALPIALRFAPDLERERIDGLAAIGRSPAPRLDTYDLDEDAQPQREFGFGSARHLNRIFSMAGRIECLQFAEEQLDQSTLVVRRGGMS